MNYGHSIFRIAGHTDCSLIRPLGRSRLSQGLGTIFGDLGSIELRFT